MTLLAATLVGAHGAGFVFREALEIGMSHEEGHEADGVHVERLSM